jgi:protein-L-isoaspartate(D-aspartate) O-methyltransferase
MRKADLVKLRRWFAEDMRVRAPVQRSARVVDAFAAVPREAFVGPGPWRVMSGQRSDLMTVTDDDDPRWLYHDVLVTIDASRGLNNGQPSLWAYVFDRLDLAPGERVLQIGAGTGYYSAVLAEIVGPAGRVIAVEHDAALAERARRSAEPWPQLTIVAGDGRTHDPGEVDVVIAFAGATHPAPLWIDRLADGGRLLMPLTGETRWGMMLRAIRHGDAFDAGSIGPIGIFPCVGGRDPDAGARLEAALKAVGFPFPPPIEALHRGAPPADAAARVWYEGPGFWLERSA